MLERIGKDTGDIQSSVYGFSMVELCDGLEGTRLDLSSRMKELEKSSTASFKKALASKKNLTTIDPYWSSKETCALATTILKEGKGPDSRIFDLIRSGRLSASRVPSLLNESLRVGSIEALSHFVEHVADMSESDQVKIILFCLTTEAEGIQELLLAVLKKPFRKQLIVGYLRNFGTLQIQSLLDILLALLKDGGNDDALAHTWLSLLIDTHFTLLVMQPAFMSQLKEMHELVVEALQAEVAIEETFGLVHALLTAGPGSRRADLGQNRNRIIVTDDYIIERDLDL